MKENYFETANAIEIKNFTKTYTKIPVVDNVSFVVKKGQFHGFIGANGAGKTTTIKSLIGAFVQFKGKILIHGHDARDIEAKQIIGYVPEKTTFPSQMSTLSYLIGMGRLSGMSKKEAKEKALHYLEFFGIKAIASRNPNKLSSGQKKKVLLVQTLVAEPKILIMDEPAANLDPQTRLWLFNKFKELQKQGKTIFISSHILAELDKYVDSVTILDGGKVKYTGLIKDFEKHTGKDLNTRTYIVNTSDNKAVVQWCKENKLHGVKKVNMLEVTFANHKSSIPSFLNFILEKEIEIITFTKAASSLENIYLDSVKKGSIETGIGGDQNIGGDFNEE